ncbi:MAG: hypothetical protein PUJ30_08730, partial [Bacteroidales bacterium]|nr:hypothetical protein [Bacteroidales bacterium]
LLKEGTGDAVGWALRACSYKTKTEASQQRRSRHTLQGVFLVFVFAPFYHFVPLSRCDLPLCPAVPPYCGSCRLKRKRQKWNKSVKTGAQKRNKSVKTGAQNRNKSEKVGFKKRNKSYFLFPRDKKS